MSINWSMALAVALGMIIFTLAAKFIMPKLGVDTFEEE